VAAHLRDPAILALRRHASQDRGPLHCNRLGDHFPFPAAYRLLCLMMPVLQPWVLVLLFATIFLSRHYRRCELWKRTLFFFSQAILEFNAALLPETKLLGTSHANKEKESHPRSNSLTVEYRHTPASRRLGVLRQMPVLK
jgi:hypothetical protein